MMNMNIGKGKIKTWEGEGKEIRETGCMRPKGKESA